MIENMYVIIYDVASYCCDISTINKVFKPFHNYTKHIIQKA